MHLIGGLTAPAVRAERDVFFLVSVEPFEISEERGDGRHHVVVEGGGADGNVLCGHGVGDDVGIVAVVQVVEPRFEPASEERAFDGVRHRFGGVPHRVKDDDGGIVEAVCDPGLIEREDLGDMFCPDDAVAGTDGLNGEICAGGQRFSRLHSVRLYDVRVIFARLDIGFGQIAFGVEPFVGSVVLPERVVGEEDVVGRHKRDHIVGPVHHGSGDEGEGALAERKRFARLYAYIAEIAVVSGEVFDARARRGVDLRVFGDACDEGEGAAVVGFRVVGYDDVDFRGIDDGGDAREHFLFEGFFDRVDERDLLVDDEIGVVSRAFLRFVAVEVPEVPVDRAYPIDAFGDLHGFHKIYSPFNIINYKAFRICLFRPRNAKLRERTGLYPA